MHRVEKHPEVATYNSQIKPHSTWICWTKSLADLGEVRRNETELRSPLAHAELSGPRISICLATCNQCGAKPNTASHCSCWRRNANDAWSIFQRILKLTPTTSHVIQNQTSRPPSAHSAQTRHNAGVREVLELHKRRICTASTRS